MKKGNKHSKKIFFPYPKYPCGLDNSQVKDAKTNRTCSKSNHHKTLGRRKDNKKKCKTRKAKPKVEKRYDKNLNRRQSRKAQKKTQRTLLNL